jgi:hypothetical protein
MGGASDGDVGVGGVDVDAGATSNVDEDGRVLEPATAGEGRRGASESLGVGCVIVVIGAVGALAAAVSVSPSVIVTALVSSNPSAFASARGYALRASSSSSSRSTVWLILCVHCRV